MMWQSENFPFSALVIIVSNNISSCTLNIQMNQTSTFLPFEVCCGLALHSSAMGTGGSFLQLDQDGLGSNEARAMKGIRGKINLILDNLRNY